MRQSLPCLRHLSTALAIGAGSLLASSVQAQHTPDPYNIVGEYNRQYEPYMYATDGVEGGVFSNQNRMQFGNRGRDVSRFSRDTDDPDGMGGRGPYPRSDSMRDRTYRPNEKTEDEFLARQEERERLFFEARREPDPAKRAKKMREALSMEVAPRNGATPKAKAGAGTDSDRLTPRSRLTDDQEDEMDSAASRRTTAPARRSVAPPPPSSRARSTDSTLPDLDEDRPLTRPGRTGSTLRRAPEPLTSPSTRSSRSPSDVLKRSRSLDRGTTSSNSLDPRSLPDPR